MVLSEELIDNFRSIEVGPILSAGLGMEYVTSTITYDYPFGARKFDFIELFLSFFSQRVIEGIFRFGSSKGVNVSSPTKSIFF